MRMCDKKDCKKTADKAFILEELKEREIGIQHTSQSTTTIIIPKDCDFEICNDHYSALMDWVKK